jgi:hypothetical protein
LLLLLDFIFTTLRCLFWNCVTLLLLDDFPKQQQHNVLN